MIKTCSNLIKCEKNIVVLTGAGISTESGIRDFRTQTGHYKVAPEYILSSQYFMENPREFYQFVLTNLYHADELPNKGHKILANWEAEGRISHIITPNIDGLNQKGGRKNVT